MWSFVAIISSFFVIIRFVVGGAIAIVASFVKYSYSTVQHKYFRRRRCGCYRILLRQVVFVQYSIAQVLVLLVFVAIVPLFLDAMHVTPNQLHTYDDSESQLCD